MDMVGEAWDAEYLSGRYAGEPPVEFVAEIRAELAKRPRIRDSRGLYAGCGNGRNFVKLAMSGLDLVGLDVSAVGLKQIADREPALAGGLVHGDFLDHAGRFGYIISIQSFQHGGAARVAKYFCKAASMLDADGILFVRINAADTEVARAHHATERDADGFTVVYGEGPKRGLAIRFLSRTGLERLVYGAGLRMARDPKMVTAARADGRGSWSQWEMVAIRPAPQ